MQYIDCSKYAQQILDDVKALKYKRRGLLILTMGNNAASESYVKGKIKDCEYCGMPCTHKRVETEKELAYAIMEANGDSSIGGIIVQLPLPDGADEEYFTNMVAAYKDVDGLSFNSEFNTCTPEGIMHVLHGELGDLTCKRALVIGRGKLVGLPIAAMLMDANCTVTIAHSKSGNIDDLIATNEIIVVAAGKAGLVDLRLCPNAIVIDVGVNRNEFGKLCGDCYGFDPDIGNGRVTPVPKGIGLMTRAVLLKHMAQVNGYGG